MKAFIDEHRNVYGVEPICKVLPIAPSTYRAHTARRINPMLRSARAQHDERLMGQVRRVWEENHQVYGVRKVWRQLNREGIAVARCTVERLMRHLGLRGAIRGKTLRTTTSSPATPCPADRVNRQFKADRPNALWVSDFTYVSTWQGFVYVAFVIDVFARRIVGWRVSATAHTAFVLDALEQALYERGPISPDRLIHHSDRGVQIRVNPLHRAPDRSGHPTLRGQRRRLLRQRPGRDDQRTVQGRGDPSAVVEKPGSSRARHLRMGGLVQPSPAAGAHWQHPTGRSRGKLLSATHRVCYGSMTQTQQPPGFPVRFIPD